MSLDEKRAINYPFYAETDVKQFIKDEEQLLNGLVGMTITWDEFWRKRNKLLGKGLI